MVRVAMPSAASTRRSAPTDARKHDRSRSPALQEGRQSAGQALLYGPRADGEPPWAGGAGPGQQAHGTAERDEALKLIDRHRGRRRRRITLGADKAYDVAAFVHALKARRSRRNRDRRHLSKTGTPRSTAIDGRTHATPAMPSAEAFVAHRGGFGWIKSSAGLAKVKLRGRARVDAAFTLALAAYNSSVCPSSWEPQDERQWRMPAVSPGPSPALTIQNPVLVFTWDRNTRGTTPAVTDGPSSHPTARLSDKSISKAAMRPASPPRPWSTSSTACSAQNITFTRCRPYRKKTKHGWSRRMLIPEQAAHLFRDDGAHTFRLIAAQGSD